MLVSISGLWRVGYHADPFSVSVTRQGAGRFDDPLRERSVLYESDRLETCITETALPWVAHSEARYVDAIQDAADDDDAELARADRSDAARDLEIAVRQGRMPATLYDRAKAFGRLAEPVRLLDLRDIMVRQQLSRVASIDVIMRDFGVVQLDLGAVTGRALRLTQAITGHLMREPFGGAMVAGICAPSRHEGLVYALFERCYAIERVEEKIRVTRDDRDVVAVARRLLLEP